MTKRMLIDATHPEETRVVVLSGNRLEEFDFETSTKKQLKGNIYLAKVTRVEPSLQAAFVEFGGNRHGFLAFSEIHPDYYQIPIADRMEILKEEALARTPEVISDEEAEEPDEDETAGGAESEAESEDEGDADGGEEPAEGGRGANFEVVGGDDEAEIEAATRRRARAKRARYKIQEVIKRRQILLVQVVKEERGTKGAALTTYLSLAGRYCVLMPNTTKGGGISRKITNPKDRKRLKGFISELDIPDGVAVILRTAATERSKAEIKRDFEYLIRTWNQVRELTLKSIAPALVYEEGNLIKRSIRDLYTKDIDEILVEGEEGYRTAKEFMRMLMPSHAKKVQPYKDESMPLFHRYQVESQLDAMHSPQVQLKSGGYIVIDPTEALVSIDVNSGRSTRERNIEETAYKTNLEAAEEIARQLKLRDLAGLIVIDFIDMTESRNQHTVERRLKEAMKADRARIQIGKISPFGLLELSRQRLRPSLIEASSDVCPHCGGTGLVRSTESAALHVLRMVEEEGIRRRSAEIEVAVCTDVALYILNQKRHMLADIESRYGFHVSVVRDDSLVPPAFRLERVAEAPAAGAAQAPAPAPVQAEAAAEEEEEKPKRKRRPRRRRAKREEPAAGEAQEGAEREPEAREEAGEETGEEAGEIEAAAEAEAEGADTQAAKSKRRRRGKRGGRRHSRKRETEAGATPADEDTGEGGAAGAETAVADESASGGNEPDLGEHAAASDAEVSPEEPRPRSRSRRRRPRGKAAAEDQAEGEPEEPAREERASRPRGRGTAESEPAPAEAVPEGAEAATAQPEEPESTWSGAQPSTEKASANGPEEVHEQEAQPGPNGGGMEHAPAGEDEREAVVPRMAEHPGDGDQQKRRGWWNRFTS